MNARAVSATIDWRPALLRAAAVAPGVAVVLLLIPVVWLELLSATTRASAADWGFTAIAALGVVSTTGVGVVPRRPAAGQPRRLAPDRARAGLGARRARRAVRRLRPARPRDGDLPGALEVASLTRYLWPWLFALLVLIVACFPEGRPDLARTPAPGARRRSRRPPSPRSRGSWRTASSIRRCAPTSRPSSCSAGAWQWVTMAAILGLFGAVVGATADIVLRLRRARGMERRQLTAFAYGALLVPASISLLPGLRSAPRSSG